MRRDDICLYLGPADRAQLEALCANRNTPRKVVWRAAIVLATADGCGTNAIMRRARTSKPTVWRWQARYLDEGVEGLQRDKTRPSRIPPLPRETRLKVITKTVKETPPDGTQWSRSSMAAAVGISPSSVGRIWAEAGLKPHLTKGFKVSNDPEFEAKVTEIVGLYLNPPERAVVLCVDEKSQIQALDRTQPGLPLKKGRAATMTHDYKRHGTTTLFAALDVKSGMVIGECMSRHRAKEFLAFLRRIDRAVLKPRDIHIVLDNYATHKTPEVQAWLAKHPRFKLHFTPTSASWLNMVERFFAEITNRRIRRGSFDSVDDLEEAIYDYLLFHNAKAKPFVWTKSAENILTRERRALDALDEIRGNR
ncbi:IS630 family transposase [Phaeovulum veldkampii]|uniref:IS630 family transposase n=2 Tax=Phaeovulum veldkampii TaxID=33049 RepID=A0A2T4J491_9RHOB|nr:IS630 family transposase [Phaeovulum veldkampii]PTE12714.1 IS630 family transposase [Phaeovulum veldkampii DSM 11550]